MTAGMAENMTAGRTGAAGRLLSFARERFPVRVYGSYAVLWVLALDGSISLVQPNIGRWQLSPYLLVEIASVLMTLLFIRIVDEQKDLAYDREHHPDRPLPRGAVRLGEVRAATVACGLAVVAVNLAISPWLAGWSLLNLGYVCLLVGWERAAPRASARLFLNLTVSYPGQLLVSGYIWLALLIRTDAEPTWHAVPVLLMFAAVFLHFEFARKTSWAHRDEPNYYSNVVGGRGSAGLAIGSALGAAAIALVMFRPWRAEGLAAFAAWFPLSAGGFLWAGGERFLSRSVPVWPTAPARGFLAWFYLGLIVQALAVQEVGWPW
ncbi:hypothetical protein [Plantactinospora sp. BB1]|uniref:hypothetical protein n=1 Tax=Plantactinospora sp. BB1 TaxID=2071627 RepID=UPI00131EDE0B|nr:hypothetical protein [Plantactinospora sp. BB1]